VNTSTNRCDSIVFDYAQNRLLIDCSAIVAKPGDAYSKDIECSGTALCLFTLQFLSAIKRNSSNTF
jgi:hypothetical protein